MKTVLAAALLALAIPTQAKPILVADESGGNAMVELHDTEGPCVGGARLAYYVPKTGVQVGGCWSARGPFVVIVFFDTDTAQIPAGAFKPASES